MSKGRRHRKGRTRWDSDQRNARVDRERELEPELWPDDDPMAYTLDSVYTLRNGRF